MGLSASLFSGDCDHLEFQVRRAKNYSLYAAIDKVLGKCFVKICDLNKLFDEQSAVKLSSDAPNSSLSDSALITSDGWEKVDVVTETLKQENLPAENAVQNDTCSAKHSISVEDVLPLWDKAHEEVLGAVFVTFQKIEL